MSEREELEEMLGIISRRVLEDYDRRGVVMDGEIPIRRVYGTTLNNLIVDITVTQVAL